MLLYTRRAPPKPAKRRSRAGCVHCKEKKKKCTEERPSCQRCIERGMDCHYEAIQPRRRRRTGSPIDPTDLPSNLSRTVSGSSSPNMNHKSRIESLKHGSNSSQQPMRPFTSSQSLGTMAGSWDTRSAYDDSGSQYGSDFQSEASLSPDLVGGFSHSYSRTSSVPVEAMGMMIGDYHNSTPRSQIGTPDILPLEYRHSTQGSPAPMSVPFRRPSELGEPEVIGSVPVMTSGHTDSINMITSVPNAQSSSYGQLAQDFSISLGNSFDMHDHNAATENMDTLNNIEPDFNVVNSSYMPSTTSSSSASYYQTSNDFTNLVQPHIVTSSQMDFYPPIEAFSHPASTTQQGTGTTAWWSPMEQIGQQFYSQQR